MKVLKFVDLPFKDESAFKRGIHFKVEAGARVFSHGFFRTHSEKPGGALIFGLQVTLKKPKVIRSIQSVKEGHSIPTGAEFISFYVGLDDARYVLVLMPE